MLKRTLLAISIVAMAFSVYGCKEKPTAQKPVTLEPAKAPAAKETAIAPATLVKLSTSMGDITIELFADKSPITVKNFLGYVNSGFYDGTVFHRVVKGFVIQGGGFTKDLKEKPTLEPIVNEKSNEVRNDRGTIAMARMRDLNSATCQFFINHKDNALLDFDGPYGGYAVFGRVLKGMDVVDTIASLPTTTKVLTLTSPRVMETKSNEVPVETVEIKSITVLTK